MASSPALETPSEPNLPALPKWMIGFALLVPQLIAGMYRGLDRTLPDLLPVLASGLVTLAIVAWFRSYCRTFQVPQPMDMGWFLMIAWPVVVPYFLISREGRRGLRRIGAFVFAMLASAIVGVASGLIVHFLKGAE